MRKIVFLFTTLLISQLTFADAWDNLTYDQAQNVVAELQENPYIFDYCDCCDFSGEFATRVYLLKVVRTEIVECSWNSDFYSVKFESIGIAELRYSKKGLSTKKLKRVIDSESSDMIYMNYTWGFNNSTKRAHPFFDLVEYTTYGEAEPCGKFFSYPSPKSVAKVSNDGLYEKWYKEKEL